MKGRSLFWPLAFIAIGIFWFLVNVGRMDAANLWALAYYWPALLIALGLGVMLRSRWVYTWTLISTLLVIGGVLVVVFAPQLGWNRAPAGYMFNINSDFNGAVAGSGKIVTATREVNGFTAVDLKYPAQVTITQGANESLTITADDNLLPQLNTTVTGSVLTIENSESNWAQRVNATHTVQVNITVKNLSELRLSGAGSITANSLEAGDLRVSASGTGNVTLANINVTNLDLSLSGTGKITASGTAQSTTLHLSGVGSFDGADLATQNMDATVSGVGSATVWVKSALTADISGTGSIRYYGSPASIDRHVSGVGSISSQGNK